MLNPRKTWRRETLERLEAGVDPEALQHSDCHWKLVLVAELLDALRERDPRRARACFTEDGSFHQPPLPRLRGTRALERILSWLTRPLTGFELAEVRCVLVDRDRLVLERVERLGLLGVDLVLRGTLVARFENGRIASLVDYIDLLSCVGAALRGIGRRLLARSPRRIARAH